jgi:hypothetical protein
LKITRPKIQRLSSGVNFFLNQMKFVPFQDNDFAEKKEEDEIDYN